VDSLRAVDGEVPELHAIDFREAELLDLAMKRVGHALDDEHHARRSRGRYLSRGIQAPHRFRVLEAPRIGFDRLEEQLLVAHAIDGDEHERAGPVEGDHVDIGVTEQEPRVEDGQVVGDGINVLDDELAHLPDRFHLELRGH
jgi:hypothetical protein